MILRRFELRDVEQIARLFHDTIHIVNLADYTEQQVEAWAPADIHFRNWAEFCSNRWTVVAEEDGLVVGYGQLEANGHIDHFYVHDRHQRKGVGSRLHAAIETEARRLNCARLFTEASITARPFFERMGHRMVRK